MCGIWVSTINKILFYINSYSPCITCVGMLYMWACYTCGWKCYKHENMVFTLHMALITKIIASSGVYIAQYADDIQYYFILCSQTPLSTLDNYFHAVHFWIDSELIAAEANQHRSHCSSQQCTDGRIASVAIGTHRIQMKAISTAW